MKLSACILPLLLLASISAGGCVGDSTDEEQDDVESVDDAASAIVSTSVSEYIYEAEAATSKSGCVIASNQPGFSGDGFMDFGGNGTWIEWNDVEVPADGQYTVTFRFGNGTATARSAAVLVNGSSAGTVPFGSTGGWSTWKTNSLTVTLHQGTNKIRLKASTGAGGPLVDRMKVKGNRVILGKPAGTTLRLASYNVNHGSSFEKEVRKAAFARIAPAVEADVWAMQEVSYGEDPAPASEGAKWVARMKSITGYQDWSYSWDARGRYLLSRHPIKWNKELKFRVHATWIDLPPGVSKSDLLVVNVHFAPENEGARRDQAAAVTEFIEDVKAGTYAANGGFIPANVTIVVAGDFNAQPDSRPFKIIHALDTRFEDDAFNQGYTPQLLNVSPITLNTNSEKDTRGAVKFTGGVGDMVGKTIDHILYRSSKLKVHSSFILNTFLLDQGTLDAVGLKRGDVAVNPDEWVGPNSNVGVDHLPLVTDFYTL